MTTCEQCKAAFDGNESDNGLAMRLVAELPDGFCESCSVGQGTDGPVGGEEELLRILVDPRDCDDGKVAERPFFAAFLNGLSVLRGVAPDDDCLDQTQEGMYRKSPEDRPRAVDAICVAAAQELRDHIFAGARSYYVYDQTVPRHHTVGDPIAGHAGVFGRALAKGTENKKLIEKDMAGELKRIFCQNQIAPGAFRNGLLTELNARSIAGEFTLVQEQPQIFLETPADV